MTNRGSLSAPSKYAKCRCCICADRGWHERRLDLAKKLAEELVMKRGFCYWPRGKAKVTPIGPWVSEPLTQQEVHWNHDGRVW